MDFNNFISDIKKWADEESQIESIVLVGSYARGEQKCTSDIDLCILTPEKDRFVEHPELLERFGTIEQLKTEYWGACTSVRVWYKNSFEVEFGYVKPDWISQPLDSGTYRVLRDGYQIIVDKKGYFTELEPKPTK